jgi:hypothetical protein
MEITEEFSLNADKLLQAVTQVCSNSGYSVIKIDKTVRRLKVSTGLSLFSYGEELEVIISPKNENRSVLYIEAKPRAWFNVTSDPSGAATNLLKKVKTECNTSG